MADHVIDERSDIPVLAWGRCRHQTLVHVRNLGFGPGSGPVVEVYDTTLRDGTQMEGMSLSCDDKLRIAEYLDSLGVTFIEGGWPGSNPKDVEFFERAKDVDWKSVTVAAFGSTCRAQLRAEDDRQLQTLLHPQMIGGQRGLKVGGTDL